MNLVKLGVAEISKCDQRAEGGVCEFDPSRTAGNPGGARANKWYERPTRCSFAESWRQVRNRFDFFGQGCPRPLYGAGGGSRTLTGFPPTDFHTSYGLRRLVCAFARRRVRGLDYTFTVARSRLRCCPSSLYTFAPAVRPGRLARDCHLAEVSPNLSSSASSVSRGALNRLSPLRLPFRHARTCPRS